MHTEGIVTHSFPFQEDDQIITLFTPNHGLIKLIIKRGQRSTRKQPIFPLSRVDCVFFAGRGEIHRCREISLLQGYLDLRNSLDNLESACSMIHAIHATQAPGKEAPSLFHLLLAYLEKIPSVQYPASLLASFRLKTLKYEGLIDWVMLPDSSFTKEEMEQIHPLLHSRSTTQIGQICLSPATQKKIHSLFTLSLQ